MQDWIVPVILGVITLVLVIAAGIVGKREGKERAEFRAQAAATPTSIVAPASLVVQTAGGPPQTWVPVLTAGSLVALGLTLLARNVFGVAPYNDPVPIGNDCNTVFQAPAEARTTTSIVATLTSTCAAVLANSALLVDGSDKSSTKFIQPPHRNENNEVQPGQAYWYLSFPEGVHHLMLLPRAGITSKSGALAVPVAAKGAKSEDVTIQTASCKVTAQRSPVVQFKFYTIDVASTCVESIGTEKILVDGLDNKAVRLSPIPPAAPAKAADRWLVAASAAPQRVDVVVDDGSAAGNAIPHDVRGKTPLGLGDAATLATTTLGSLSTLGGLIAGVLALFRRP